MIVATGAARRARGRSSGRSSAPSSCSGPRTSTRAPWPGTGSSTATIGIRAWRSARRSAVRSGLVASAMIPSFILLLGATQAQRRHRRSGLALWVGVLVLAVLGWIAFARRGRPGRSAPRRRARHGRIRLRDDPAQGFHPLRVMRPGRRRARFRAKGADHVGCRDVGTRSQDREARSRERGVAVRGGHREASRARMPRARRRANAAAAGAPWRPSCSWSSRCCSHPSP